MGKEVACERPVLNNLNVLYVIARSSLEFLSTGMLEKHRVSDPPPHFHSRWPMSVHCVFPHRSGTEAGQAQHGWILGLPPRHPSEGVSRCHRHGHTRLTRNGNDNNRTSSMLFNSRRTHVDQQRDRHRQVQRPRRKHEELQQR